MRYIQRTWFIDTGKLPADKANAYFDEQKVLLQSQGSLGTYDRFTIDVYVQTRSGSGETRLQVDELRFD
jgi:hypothetical protein